VDYFVCPRKVQEVYGEKPKELKIMFPTEDENQWASQFYRCYSQTRGLICKGDGETATALIDEKTGALATHDTKNAVLREMPCDPEHCPYYGKHCRMVMNLQFLLPDVPGLGIWQLDTSSYWSITNINSYIKFIKGICGRVSLIPLTLALVPQQVQPNGRKKMVYTLSLRAEFRLSEALRFASLPPREALLPTPDAEAPEDLFPEKVLNEAKEEMIDEQETAEKESKPHPEGEISNEKEPVEPEPAEVIREPGLSSKEQLADVEDAWQQIKR
jgi:hypothetical protein